MRGSSGAPSQVRRRHRHGLRQRRLRRQPAGAAQPIPLAQAMPRHWHSTEDIDTATIRDASPTAQSVMRTLGPQGGGRILRPGCGGRCRGLQ